MQLMPATAARFGVSNASVAADNIRGGVKFLDFLVEKVASVGGSVTAEDVEACERSGIPLVHPCASDSLTRSLRSLWDRDGKIPWQGDR